MKIIPHKKIFVTISAILVAASLISIAVFGLNIGVEFTGGSIIEVNYPDTSPATTDIETVLADLSLPQASVQQAGETGFLLRTGFLSPEIQAELLNSLSFGDTYTTE